MPSTAADVLQAEEAGVGQRAGKRLTGTVVEAGKKTLSRSIADFIDLGGEISGDCENREFALPPQAPSAPSRLRHKASHAVDGSKDRTHVFAFLINQ
jgi:hypothetical protein